MVQAPCKSAAGADRARSGLDQLGGAASSADAGIPARWQGPQLACNLAPALGHVTGRTQPVGDDRVQDAGRRIVSRPTGATKTDRATVERFAREMTAVRADPVVVRRLSKAGFKPMAMTLAQIASY
jgi:hypothetical protein